VLQKISLNVLNEEIRNPKISSPQDQSTQRQRTDFANNLIPNCESRAITEVILQLAKWPNSLDAKYTIADRDSFYLKHL